MAGGQGSYGSGRREVTKWAEKLSEVAGRWLRSRMMLEVRGRWRSLGEEAMSVRGRRLPLQEDGWRSEEVGWRGQGRCLGQRKLLEVRGNWRRSRKMLMVEEDVEAIRSCLEVRGSWRPYEDFEWEGWRLCGQMAECQEAGGQRKLHVREEVGLPEGQEVASGRLEDDSEVEEDGGVVRESYRRVRSWREVRKDGWFVRKMAQGSLEDGYARESFGSRRMLPGGREEDGWWLQEDGWWSWEVA
ncbi:hypothetical protein FNV43_RR14963 [Rhamnella rubrinervis]|uniref:Uncharacterized protein n=1 Tax=Rhamnella rubrinervis TaxID=2594499 RepID=A0A8K0H431_9ROSA|nr:hypothetical protein FNV43_RR14963 [Rhamnella rubrinervis]